MKETLDYQARYRPGKKQLQARIFNLLRGNGKKAIAQGWDTRYERSYELPASLLFEALHDLMTGWGSRALDVPVTTLQLDCFTGRRPDERSAGHVCVRPCRSRWSAHVDKSN